MPKKPPKKDYRKFKPATVTVEDNLLELRDQHNNGVEAIAIDYVLYRKPPHWTVAYCTAKLFKWRYGEEYRFNFDLPKAISDVIRCVRSYNGGR